MVKYEAKVNSRIEIIIDDEIAKSNIQDVNDKSFLISMPMLKGQLVKFNNGEIVELYNYVDGDKLLKLSCKVIGRGKVGNVLVYELEYPIEVEKIQRREFYRAHIVDKISYIKSDEDKSYKAILLDISGGGMRIKFDESMNIGDIITIKYGENHDELNIRGEIMRVDKINGQYDCGISYYQIDSKSRDKVIQRIFTIMRKQRELN